MPSHFTADTAERRQWQRALSRRKLVRDGLVLHDTGKSVDGLSAGEDGVSRLSFSPVDAYVLLGRYGDAYEPFERLLALRNDVGLLAEEYDAHDRRQLGNFPQAFSHLALINAAHSLTTAEGAARLRSRKSGPARLRAKRGTT